MGMGAVDSGQRSRRRSTNQRRRVPRRAQLSHWLNTDLEEIKARHGRELEAYRTSLIAEVERVKATQAIKTAKALRIAEKEFAAIERLHRALVPYATQAIVYLQHFSPQSGERDYKEITRL